jgi:hypothetical protein
MADAGFDSSSTSWKNSGGVKGEVTKSMDVNGCSTSGSLRVTGDDFTSGCVGVVPGTYYVGGSGFTVDATGTECTVYWSEDAACANLVDANGGSIIFNDSMNKWQKKSIMVFVPANVAGAQINCGTDSAVLYVDQVFFNRVLPEY